MVCKLIDLLLWAHRSLDIYNNLRQVLPSNYACSLLFPVRDLTFELVSSVVFIQKDTQHNEKKDRRRITYGHSVQNTFPCITLSVTVTWKRMKEEVPPCLERCYRIPSEPRWLMVMQWNSPIPVPPPVLATSQSHSHTGKSYVWFSVFSFMLYMVFQCSVSLQEGIFQFVVGFTML